MVSIEFIKKTVERHCNIEDISIDTRKRPYPYYRNIYYKLCKEFCAKGTSLASIGSNLNGRDHATVLHGLKVFHNSEDQDWFKEFYEIYLECKKEIYLVTKDMPEYKILKSIDEVKTEYRIKHIKLSEKAHSVIGSLTFKLNNLRHRPIFKEIAELDDETLDLFEKRAKAFMAMNKKEELIA